MKSKKIVRIIGMVLSAAVFCFAAWKLLSYALSTILISSSVKDLSNEAVTVVETAEPTPTPTPTEAPAVDEPIATQLAEATPFISTEQAPISVDFNTLTAQHPDIVGWLYQEGTVINYPVVQTTDNDYYLYRMIDGTENTCGTLFMDFRDDIAGEHPIAMIYGHNMKTGIMFGTVDKYKEQDYYEKHPVLWYMTANGGYKLEAAAGFVVDATDAIFANGTEHQFASLQKGFEKSTFDSGISYSEKDRYVILSTCSYEYDNARYLLVCRAIALAQ